MAQRSAQIHQQTFSTALSLLYKPTWNSHNPDASGVNVSDRPAYHSMEAHAVVDGLGTKESEHEPNQLFSGDRDHSADAYGSRTGAVQAVAGSAACFPGLGRL